MSVCVSAMIKRDITIRKSHKNNKKTQQSVMITEMEGEMCFFPVHIAVGSGDEWIRMGHGVAGHEIEKKLLVWMWNYLDSTVVFFLFQQWHMMSSIASRFLSNTRRTMSFLRLLMSLKTVEWWCKCSIEMLDNQTRASSVQIRPIDSEFTCISQTHFLPWISPLTN